MYQRIESDDAGPRLVRDRQGTKVSLVERDRRVEVPSGLHEGRGKIPAGNLDTPFVKVGGHVSGAASEIGDWSPGPDPSSVPREEFAIERLAVKLGGDPTNVFLGHLVIGTADVVERLDLRPPIRTHAV